MLTTNAILTSYLGMTLSFLLVIFMVSSSALAQPMMTGNISSGSSSIGMNVADIFNGSSLFGALGMSMVDGVKIAGVNVLSNNDVSVTLKHIITNPANTTIPGGVTVIAIKVPMNLRNLISAASTLANNTTSGGGGNNVMNMMTGPMQGFGVTRGGNSTSFLSNPFVFLKSIQIGSSNIANPNWRVPQSVTMGLTGMIGSSSSNNGLSSSSPQTADFIIVSVIPFTGKSNQ